MLKTLDFFLELDDLQLAYWVTVLILISASICTLLIKMLKVLMRSILNKTESSKVLADEST